jgi:hypothetical protein
MVHAPSPTPYASHPIPQVLAWCMSRNQPFQGVLALDECHRAKAAGGTRLVLELRTVACCASLPTFRARCSIRTATGAGSAVLHLQSQLPLARVVYSSATSATELHNLQYLSRLGLWGVGTPFSSFGAFRDEMSAVGFSHLT